MCIMICIFNFKKNKNTNKTKNKTKQSNNNKQTKKQKTNKTRKQEKKRKRKERRKDNISVENLTRYDATVMFVNLLSVLLSYWSSREFLLVVHMNLI